MIFDKPDLTSIGGYCCQAMKGYIESEDSLILYQPYFRVYAVKVGNNIAQQIHFCPWCGKILPHDLSNSFFETVRKELGLDGNLSEIKNLPTEFQTDEWWKKRGL